MIQVDMVARVRTTFGKGAARTLRREGQTPAVLYGPDAAEPIALQLEARSFAKALLSIHRRNAVINLDVDHGGKTVKRHVVAKEVQTDPIHDTVVHTDFYEISLDEPMTFDVPLRYVGKAKGVDMGGDLLIAMKKVTLKGKVLDIPDHIEVDVTPLGLGGSIACQELAIPDLVALEEKPDTVCVSVSVAATGE